MRIAYTSFACLLFCCGTAAEHCDTPVEKPRAKPRKAQTEMRSGYSAAARPLKDQCWDFFFGGSFLYWHSDEDGLSVGRRIPADRHGVAPTLNEKILLHKFSYKPGFKVFLGFGNAYDNWDFFLGWTRLHQTTHAHYTFDGVNDAILLESWVHLLDTAFLANQVQSSWKLHFDLLDATLSRPFFSGKHLTFAPVLGLRTAWIDQDFSIIYQFTNTDPMEGDFKSDSWGIGPLAGFFSNWKLGSGFSIFGKASASLLYTSYTTLKLFETIRVSTPTAFAATGVNADYDPYDTVRANAGLGLGFAWGSHLCEESYYIDFAATYDFNVFWHQNMLRGISDNYSFAGSEAAISSLNLHGLTATASFDF